MSKRKAAAMPVEDGQRLIQYIGSKTHKVDNVLHRPGRRWDGHGAVLAVSAEDAATYAKFPMIWRDVTGLSEDEVGLARLAAEKPKPVGPKVPAKDAPDDIQAQIDGEFDATGEVRERMVAEVAEAIGTLDPENPEHYTVGGQPRLEALTEAVGFVVVGKLRESAMEVIEADDDKGNDDDLQPPETPSDEVMEVVDAMGKLGAEDFTKNGTARADALKRVLGRDVPPEQRDAARDYLVALADYEDAKGDAE